MLIELDQIGRDAEHAIGIGAGPALVGAGPADGIEREEGSAALAAMPERLDRVLGVGPALDHNILQTRAKRNLDGSLEVGGGADKRRHQHEAGAALRLGPLHGGAHPGKCAGVATLQARKRLEARLGIGHGAARMGEGLVGAGALGAQAIERVAGLLGGLCSSLAGLLGGGAAGLSLLGGGQPLGQRLRGGSEGVGRARLSIEQALVLGCQLLGAAVALVQRGSGRELGTLSGLDRALRGAALVLARGECVLGGGNGGALLGQVGLGGGQPLGHGGALAIKLLAAQIELIQAALELLAAADERGLALVADGQIALDGLGAGV